MGFPEDPWVCRKRVGLESGFLWIRVVIGMMKRREIGGNESGEEEKSEMGFCRSSGGELDGAVRRPPLEFLGAFSQ